MKRLTATLVAVCVGAVLALAVPVQDKAVDEKGNPVGAPKLIKKVSPVYPEEAKKEGVVGDVLVEVRIDEAGKVMEATASKSSDARLSKAAIDAVKQWEFQPAKVDGKTVKVKATITVRFRLQ